MLYVGCKRQHHKSIHNIALMIMMGGPVRVCYAAASFSQTATIIDTRSLDGELSA